MTLVFDSELHKYTWLEYPKQTLTSVSTLIGMYHEKFDSELRSRKYAEKHKLDQQEVLKMWDDKKVKSQIKGTKYHEKKEKELLGKTNVFEHSQINGLKQAFDITELKPGIYPELIVYHPKYNIVGTADKVVIYKDMTFDLSDFKTNEKLEFKGFSIYNKALNKRVPKKMFSPVQHLDDCNGIHYGLQLSAYAFCLEEAGYTCNSLTINHVQFDEDEQDILIIDYPINYLKKEIKNIFEHFKSKQ